MGGDSVLTPAEETEVVTNCDQLTKQKFSPQVSAIRQLKMHRPLSTAGARGLPWQERNG